MTILILAIAMMFGGTMLTIRSLLVQRKLSGKHTSNVEKELIIKKAKTYLGMGIALIMLGMVVMIIFNRLMTG